MKFGFVSSETGHSIEWKPLHRAWNEVIPETQADFVRTITRHTNEMASATRESFKGADGDARIRAFQRDLGFAQAQVERSAHRAKFGSRDAEKVRNAAQVAAAGATRSR